MKKILLMIALFFSVNLIYAQVEDIPLFSGKVFMSQTGSGAGYWEVSGTFQDQSGYDDASGIQVGHILFFTDAGIGYHLPVTVVVSTTDPSFTVRVNNTGITGVIGVPTGEGVFYEKTTSDLVPFVSGITDPNQQTLLQYSTQKIQEALDTKLSTTLPDGTVFIGNASNIATSRSISGDATITNTGSVTVDRIDNIPVTAAGASSGQVLKWNGTAWVPDTDNGGNTDLSVANRTSTTLDVISNTGTDATIPAATTTLAGLQTAVDKVKSDHITVTQAVDLDAIEAASHDAVTLGTGSPKLTLSGQQLTLSDVNDADASITNEVLTITDGTNTEALGGQTLTVTGTGGITPTYNTGSNTLTIDGSSLDGSITNEGSISVGAGGGNSSTIVSNTSTSPTITIVGANSLLVTENTGTNTITLTAPDGSDVNEGNLSLGAGASNTTTIVSNTAGSNTLTVSGATNINVTENTGTNTLTIEAALPDGTVYIGNGSNIAQSRTISGDATITNTGTLTVDKIDNIQVLATGATNGQVLAWSTSNSQWEATTNGNGTVTSVAATAGAGISISGSPITTSGTLTITNTGDTDASNDITTSTTSGGDLSGTYPNPLVDGLQGNAVSNTAPTTGQVLKWNGSAWTPDVDATGGAGSTDLSITNRTTTTLDVASSSGIDATVPAATTSLAGLLIADDKTKLDNTTITQPVDLDVLEAASHAAVTVTDNARIDLTLTGQNIQADLLQNGATNGQVYKWNGSVWAPSADNNTTYTGGTGIDVTGTVITNTGIITEVDGNISNEGSLTVGAGTSTTSIINSNTSGSTGVTITSGTGLAIFEVGNVITIDNTDPDQSTTNELQTLAASSNATSHTTTLSNTGGSLQLVEGSGITLTTSGTALDGIVTIAATGSGTTDLSVSGTSSPLTIASSTGTDITVTAGTGVSLTGTSTDITINNTGILTEIDGNISNEGQLSLSSGTGTTTIINSNTSGQTPVTINASTGLSISENTGTNNITLTNTSPDQTVVLTEGGTIDITGTYPSFTITGTGISETLTSGNILVGNASNIAQSRTMSGDATITNTGLISVDKIDNVQVVATGATTGQVLKFNGTNWVPDTDTGADTDLSIAGTTSPLFLESSTGTDITIIEGPGITVSGAPDELTITNSAPDQVVALTEGGIVDITGTYPNFTITATEVDGSTSNELQTIANTSDGTTHTATLSNSGGSLQLAEGAGITLTTTGTGLNGIVTIASTASGTTNLTVGGTSSPLTLESSSGSDITVTAGTGISLTGTSTNMTINNTGIITEVDGFVTNEGSLAVSSGTGSTSVINSNTSGSTGITFNAGTGLSISENTGTNNITLTNSAPDQTVSLTGAGINVVSGTYPTFTITGTEVDGSTSNELQTVSATSDATSHTETLSNSGGSFQLVEGSGITLTTTGTSSDAIITIASTGSGTSDLTFTGSSSPLTLNSSSGTDVTFTAGTGVTLSGTSGNATITNSAPDQTVVLTGGGITSISGTYPSFTITSTEVDGNISNEGHLSLSSGTASTTVINSNSSGSTPITVNAGTGLTISENTGTNNITLTNSAPDQTVSIGNGGGIAVSGTYPAFTLTATDQSTTNELQTVAGTSDATSHTTTLSNSGGSLQLVEGSNVTLTTSGTGLDAIVTIASTGGTTDLTISGTSSPLTVNSSSGTDITLTAGTGISLSGSSGNATITNTGIIAEVDGSITNEGSLTVNAGSGTTSVISSNTSASTDVTLTAGSGLSISESGNNITLTATDVSATNELQTVANTSDATTHTATLSNSGGSIQLVEGSNITLTTSGTTGDGIVTIAATAALPSLANNNVWVGNVSNVATAVNPSGDADISNTGAITVDKIDGIAVDATGAANLDLLRWNGTTSTWENSEERNQLLQIIGTTDPELQLLDNDGAVASGLLVAGYRGLLAENDGGNLSLSLPTGSAGQVLKWVGSAWVADTDLTGSGAADLTFTGASSPYTLNSSTGTDVTFAAGSGVTLSRSSNELTVTAVDVSATNEAQTLTIAGTTSPTVSLNAISGTGGGTATFTGAGITALSQSGGTITITSTEVDGSITNELQTVANTSDATSHTATLSNSGGSLQLVEGTGVTLTTSGTGLNGIATIAATTNLDFTGTSSPVTLRSSNGTDVTFSAGSNISLVGSGTDLIINATPYGYNTIQEEGSTLTTQNILNFVGTTATASDGGTKTNVTFDIDVNALASTSTTGLYAVTGSGSSATRTITAGTGISVSNGNGVSGNPTITNTDPDQSTTNELQTIANTSNATTHTATLSNSGGSLQLAEGSGITLTTSGTGLDGIVTIASTSTGVTDLSFSGGSSPYTLHSSTGTDVTFAQGVGLTFTRTDNELSIDADDFSPSNEGSLSVGSGTSTTSLIQSNTTGSTSVTLEALSTSGLTLAESGNTITLTMIKVLREETFTATASQTAFTMAYSAPAVSGTAYPLRVFRNGVELNWVASAPSITQYTYSGTTLTTAANTVNDIVRVNYFN